MPITLAMSWRAVLPCADCPGIRTTVTLLPYGSYRRDDAYLGAGEIADTILGEVGRYTLDRSGERLTLHGTGDAPGYFVALADGNLRMLDHTGAEIESEHDHTLTHLPNPVRQEGVVTLTGLFTYLADSALLLECRGGVQFPVAMLGEYLALESAYLERGLSGAPLPVRVSGRVEDRPAMEGDGNEPVFLVSSFEVLADRPTCPALDLRDALALREWELEWVWGDVEGVEIEGGETPTLIWNSADQQLSGSSGCNRFMGRGVLRGSLLVSGAMAGTRRFCEGAMEREARILSLFTNDLVVRIEGEELTLHRRGEVAAVYRRAEER
jgi:heat shock protein HslJ/uncharacterized lipoprotein NlpE involved in copper resistance